MHKETGTEGSSRRVDSHQGTKITKEELHFCDIKEFVLYPFSGIYG